MRVFERSDFETLSRDFETISRHFGANSEGSIMRDVKPASRRSKNLNKKLIKLIFESNLCVYLNIL